MKGGEKVCSFPMVGLNNNCFSTALSKSSAQLPHHHMIFTIIPLVCQIKSPEFYIEPNAADRHGVCKCVKSFYLLHARAWWCLYIYKWFGPLSLMTSGISWASWNPSPAHTGISQSCPHPPPSMGKKTCSHCVYVCRSHPSTWTSTETIVSLEYSWSQKMCHLHRIAKIHRGSLRLQSVSTDHC